MLPRFVRRAVATLPLVLAVAACGSRRPPDAVALMPVGGQAEARMHVAAIADSEGRPEVALGLYRSAALREPGNRSAQSRYAGALARSGDIAQAQSVLANALRSAPEDEALLRGLATLELRSGHAGEAEGLFRRILASHHDDARAQGGLGVALDLEDRHAEAQVAHRAAYAADPTNASLANNLAVSLMLSGQSQEAVAVLEPLRFRGDVPQRLLTNLALAQVASGGGVAGNDARTLLEGQASRTQIDSYITALGDTKPKP